MNCEQVKELLPDYLAGSLPENVRDEFQNHLAACAACREEANSLQGLWTGLSWLPEVEPGPAMDARFRGMLAAYRAGMDQPERRGARFARWLDWLVPGWFFQPAWQSAVVLLLFGGGLLAGWSLGRGAGEPSVAGGSEIAELRREVVNLKEQMALALLDQTSATERLRGVDWTSRLEQPDEEILRALLRALDLDPNVNVRLAAVAALQPFAREAVVQRLLLESLPRQPSPLVQAELINLLVSQEDKDLVPVLESMLNKGDLNETVRERAQWGLAQLG